MSRTLQVAPGAIARRLRHVPMRTCAGCGARAAKATLRRIGLSDARGLEWRLCGGRGTYLHADGECCTLFRKATKPLRGLRARIGREQREILLASHPLPSVAVESTREGTR